MCVPVYIDAYVSDLHYLQEATENCSASSLGRKKHTDGILGRGSRMKK